MRVRLEFWVIAFVFFLTGITSCTKTCDNGYEGQQCNVAANLKFAGVYSVTDTALINSVADRHIYTMKIIALTDPSKIALQNFGGTDSVLTGVVSANSFIVDSVVLGKDTVKNTYGSLTDSTIVFTYMLDTVKRYASGRK